MRITMFTNSYKPTVSGVVTSISMFRRGLIDNGHEVHIIAPDYRDYEDDEPYIFRFPALDLSDQVELSLIVPLKTPMTPTVRGVKPELIHSQHPIWMGDLAAAFARDLLIPLVFTFHTRYDEYAQRYVPIASELASMVTEEIIRRYLAKCAHIIAPTPSVRDLILEEFASPDTPVTVIPTPIDRSEYAHPEPQRIRSRLGLEEAEILLYVGRLAEEKNVSFLIRAFARVARARPQAYLVIVGRGPKQDNLQKEVQKLALGDRVVFTGAIPHKEVPHYAAAADLFVFPSETETQGLVLIEAMAAGCPVVAVNAPASLDVLAEGGGQLAPPREDQFAGAVLELLNDESRRKKLAAEAVQAMQRYTLDAATERLIRVYEEAVSFGPRQRA